MFCTSLCRGCLETSFSEFSVLLLRHAQSNVQKLCSLPDWPGICHLGWWLWYDYVMFFVMSDWSKMPPHCHASIYFNIFNMRSFLANSPPGKIQNLLGGMHDESLHAQVPYAPPKATAKPEPLPANSPLSSGGSVVLQARLSWVRGSEAGSEKRRAFENCELQWTWEASKHRLRPDIEDSVGGSPGLLAVWHLNPNRSKRSCRVGDMWGVCFFSLCALHTGILKPIPRGQLGLARLNWPNMRQPGIQLQVLHLPTLLLVLLRIREQRISRL